MTFSFYDCQCAPISAIRTQDRVPIGIGRTGMPVKALVFDPDCYRDSASYFFKSVTVISGYTPVLFNVILNFSCCGNR
jgi:hypothetical protein